MRLAAELRFEAEQHNTAAATSEYKGGDLAFNRFRMQQQAAFQRIGLFGITRQYCSVEAGQRLKGGAGLEHDYGRFRDAEVGGQFRMLCFDAQQCAGAEELVALCSLDYVFNRQGHKRYK